MAKGSTVWRILYSAAATMNTITWGIYFSFTRRYIGVELGGGIHALLLITGLEWLYVLFALLAGRFSKRIGERKSVLVGALGAVPFAVSTLLRDPIGLALVLSLTSLTWSITWPLVMNAVFSGVGMKLGRAYSLFTIGTGLGFSVGSSVMGLLYYAGGPTFVFTLCSVLHVATYSIFYVFYPERGGGQESDGGRPEAGLSWVRGLGYVFIAYALLVFCREAYFSVAPVKLSTEISRILPGASEESQYLVFGVLYGGLTAFLSVPVRLAVGFLVDRYDPRVLLTASFALYMMSYWLFILLEGLASVIVWQLPLYPVVDTSINVLLAKSTTGGSRTHALGAGMAFSAIGGLGVLPLIAYPNVDPVSIGTLITAAALCGMVFMARALLSIGRRGRI